MVTDEVYIPDHVLFISCLCWNIVSLTILRIEETGVFQGAIRVV